MKQEIRIAAKLWREQIENGSQDMGEFMGNIFANLLKNSVPKPSNEQLDTFENVLCREMEREIVECDTWNIEKPMFGECTFGRMIGTDYDPDPILQTALNESDINYGLVPIKSTTWCSPGYVYYSFGYGKKPEKIEVRNDE